jgi:gliding motility-associated-like protein
MKSSAFLLILIGFIDIACGQNFTIVGNTEICTAPYEYTFFIETEEVGYSYSWYLLGHKVGEGESVKLKVANEAAYSLVLVAQKEKEELSLQHDFTAKQTPVIRLDDEVVLCPEGTTTISSSENFGLLPTSIVWKKDGLSLLNDVSEIEIHEEGLYELFYDNQGCLSNTASLHVFETVIDLSIDEVYTSPEEPFSLGLDKSVLTLFDVSLVGEEHDMVLTGFIGQFLASVSDLYHVKLISKDKKCTFDLNEKVNVIVQGELTFPNAFTPNGDGINDDWVIEGISDYKQSKITVLSRWSGVVFQGYGRSLSTWNGEFKGVRVPTAVYYYVVELNDSSGRTFSGDISVIY